MCTAISPVFGSSGRFSGAALGSFVNWLHVPLSKLFGFFSSTMGAHALYVLNDVLIIL